MYTFFFVLLISILDDCDEVLKPGKLSYTNTASLAYCLLFIVSLHLLVKHFLLLVILGEVSGKVFVCFQTLQII